MLKSIELSGFKSFAKKTEMNFPARISAIVGPNGSGKSNSAEAFRFALGEQSMKSLRGKRSDDLLWNGSSQMPRANRAGVKITFDNAKRALGIDFDEVAVERIMHRDSSHQYYLNDSQVRLKDVLETLAAANIGPTGHHIISQGEADRILSVKPSERKRIIEDALGLKIYHYKKGESEKKLSKTYENLQEILGLQREIEPTLRVLSKQMSRIERARELREEIQKKARLYFASTEYYNRDKETELAQKEQDLIDKKKMHEENLSSIDRTSEDDSKQKLEELRKKRKEVEEKKRSLLSLRRELERTIGRLEGHRDALKDSEEKKEGSITFSRLKTLKGEILAVLEEENVGDRIHALFDACMNLTPRVDTTDQEDTIRRELEEKKKEEATLGDDENTLNEELSSIEKDIELVVSRTQGAGDEVLSLKDGIRSCESGIQEVKRHRHALTEAREEMKREVAELGIVFGREVASYEDLLTESTFTPLAENTLRDVRRDIERGRIKIEDADLSQARDIEREYSEAKERNDFLQKEIDDLHSTRSSLEHLIRDLEGELNEKFKEGIEHINDQFNHFFTILFGGGGAQLMVVRDEKADGEGEEGVEIDVQLPRKRIRGLAMLSGGERALTSIALVFSISYINPPPFLILDETDAALDEANSRKYGDMIEELSEQSQLVLVTHNRETMSRAGLLYGVTMGADGVSRLLSVKFEDAKEMAAR